MNIYIFQFFVVCLFVVCCLLFVVCSLLFVVVGTCCTMVKSRDTTDESGPERHTPGAQATQPTPAAPHETRGHGRRGGKTRDQGSSVPPLEEEAIHLLLKAGRKASGEARGAGIVHAEPITPPQGEGAVVASGQLPIVQEDRHESVVGQALDCTVPQCCDAQPFPRHRERRMQLA